MKTIYWLPGFLSHSNDFQSFIQNWPCKKTKHHVVDYRGCVGLSLLDWIEESQRHCNVQEAWAIGYSLGGRLLLNWNDLFKESFEKILLVSPHPGIDDPDQKKTRILRDKTWAKRWQTESAEDLKSWWNGLPVFNGSRIKEFELFDKWTRQELAWQTLHWSAANHIGTARQLLDSLPKSKILLGDLDVTYCQIFSQYSQLEDIKIISQAGHRLWYDQPEVFFKEAIDFFIGP